MSKGIFTEELFILEEKPLKSIVDIEAEFSRYIYEKEDGSFFIGLFITNNYEEFVVAGSVPFPLVSARSYVVSGEINERENKHTGTMERQLKLQKIVTLKPKGEAQIIKFLAELTGAVIASYIFSKYGEESLEVIKGDPERVSNDFRRITLKQAEKLQLEVLDALSEVSEAFPFLQKYGFSTAEVEELIKTFGEEIKAAVEDNPFILMRNGNGYPGASFVKCDKIAHDIKFNLLDSNRVKAGVEYALLQQGNQGHIYYETDGVISLSLEVLNGSKGAQVSKRLVEKAIENMIIDRQLHMDSSKGTLYIERFYRYEQQLAFNLVSLQNDDIWIEDEERIDMLERMLHSKRVELEAKQRQAVLDFSESKSGVGVLNGGAGTGKTFTLNIYLELMEQLYRKKEGRLPLIMLMAPTGKAAKVMTGATGREAGTIHRTLGWTNEGFVFNEGNPLSADIVVVDEASMLDTHMGYSLTRALKPNTKLILLGDPNQLASIGAGNVLHDIVRSERFDVITLNVVKRQAEKSQVAINARLITEQKMPEKDPDKEDPKAITKGQRTAEGLVNQTLKAFQYLASKGISYEEIQVITPGRKGLTGMHHINYKLQEMINPSKGNKEILNHGFNVKGIEYKLNFRIGDRVIHTTNTDKLQWVKKSRKGDSEKYTSIDEIGAKKIVTNGEIGLVEDIFEERYVTQSGRKQKRDAIVIKYDDGLVKYTNDDKKNLDHAYAMTIHKSQGSQWRAVIQIISMEHPMLLDNSLLYTGYTRPEDYQVLLASPKALSIALNTRKSFERKTSLMERIQEENI